MERPPRTYGERTGRPLRVLISGAGIAGPTLAWWLRRYGIESLIVERAPQLRTGGYIIDFWGAGFDIADQMGLLPEVQRAAYTIDEVRIVDGHGRRAGGFPVDAFRRVTNGRYVSIPRGELAAILFRAIENDVESIFGDSIATLEEREESVHVEFEKGTPRDFDAVIGADGLHSLVRSLAFGPDRRFETYLGYGVAAFEVDGYEPRDERVYVMYTEVGRQIARFAMRGGRTMFLFIYDDRDSHAPSEQSLESQKAFLRNRFAGSQWESAKILEAMETTRSIYMDRVSQIRMDSWSRGRIGLVGDAAYCASLLAGQGSALAMIGAYVLASELRRANGDVAGALHRYHEYLAKFLSEKQKMAVRFAGSFVPPSRARLWLRNQLSKTLSIPLAADIAARRGLIDRIDLPPVS